MKKTTPKAKCRSHNLTRADLLEHRAPQAKEQWAHLCDTFNKPRLWPSSNPERRGCAWSAPTSATTTASQLHNGAACAALLLLPPLAQVHLVLCQRSEAFRLPRDIRQAQPVGSVALTVRVRGRERVEEDMAEVRGAPVAHDLEATPLLLGPHVAAVGVLRKIALFEDGPATIA